jgi:flagellar biogenesis protein FliO
MERNNSKSLAAAQLCVSVLILICMLIIVIFVFVKINPVIRRNDGFEQLTDMVLMVAPALPRGGVVGGDIFHDV